MADELKLYNSPLADLYEGTRIREAEKLPIVQNTGVPYGWVYALLFSDWTYYVGKVARGKSGRNPQKRFYDHCGAYKSGAQAAVYNAWRELGEPKLEVLADYFPHDGASDSESKAGLDALEQKWIADVEACNRKFGHNVRGAYAGRLLFEEE